MTWDRDLTGAALEIASTENSPLRVLAGPGTGKTFALMRRMSRLLEQGADPTRILLITFTRMAANDLQQAIQELRVNGAENVKKGTLHSFCYEMLDHLGVLRIIDRVPRTLLDFEVRFLLEDLSEQGVGTIHERKRRLRAFEAAWATEQDRRPGWPENPIDQHFHQILIDWLRFHRSMLIGELIPLSLDYIEANPQSEFRNAFDHVLIDEYQDLNPAEQRLIDLFSENGTLTVIGDADQSIYEHLRFAHPEGIISFPDRHDGTQSVQIQECRRCPELVVHIATSLIANNRNRLANLELLPHAPNGFGEVVVVQWTGMQEEALGLANYITVKIASGEFNPGQTLILSPRRQLGYQIRDALRANGVPAHSFFAEELLDGDPKDINGSLSQQALTILNLLADPEDRVSLRCWLGFGHNNLCRRQYVRIRDYAVEHNISPRTVLEQLVARQIRIRHTGYLVERFQLLTTRLNDLAELTPVQVFDTLFPNGQAWAERFREIRDDAFGEGDSILQILQKLRINILQPELPTDVDYVRIMSPQKSKGLTADNVIITGCIEGLFPSSRRELEDAALERFIEEQRRLFYVAITRTRRVLVISSFASMPMDLAFQMGAVATGTQGNQIATITSRFMRQLGPHAPASIRGENLI